MGKLKEQIFLQNVVEANLLSSLLQEEGIPHFIKEYVDPVYKGSWHFVDAWGHVECPSAFKQRISSLLAGIRESGTGS